MGTIHKPRETCEIPQVDLLSFIFSSGDASSRKRPMFIDAFRPERHYSLADGEQFARRIGLGLTRLGLRPDDKVLLYSANNIYFPTLLWGVIAAGCVFTAVSPSGSRSELEGQLRDSDAKVLIAGLGGVENALKAASAVGIPESQVFVFCDPLDSSSVAKQTKLKPWTELWASEQDGAKYQWKQATDMQYLTNTTVILNYSSGTTGPPKGVEITHRNVVANISQIIRQRTHSTDTPASHARNERLARSGERFLAPLPMYHAYGQMTYCILAPRQSAKVYIMERYDIKLLLHFLDAYRITQLTGVPLSMVQMSKQPPGIYNLEALEYAVTGSAPLGADTGKAIEDNFFRPGLHLRQGWGMTELTCHGSGFWPDDVTDRASVGFLGPNCYGKVVPVDGQDWADEVPKGLVAGELWVAGPNAMKGYYKRPQATADTIVEQDGLRWVRTGDIAYFDREEKIYIIDRLKELIKVKGLQVSPSELEAAIVLHEGVSDVAVVGAKIDGGEYPRAFIVRKDPALKEQTIHDLMKKQFAPHKWLTGGIYFIDVIPKTPSGKTQRRLLPNPQARALKL